jgi:acyl-CoA reductase-like NAD-dependent aldehyde dehydrogenase
MANEELLRHASVDDRSIVTEDAQDLDRIVRAWVATAEHHAGVIFTSPRRFHRGSGSYPENLAVALTTLLESPSDDQRDWVHWLQ